MSNYQRVQSTPLALAGLLAALAVAALGHTLVTWVRHRRRELAVYRAVGFVRRQVSATVAWQATTLAGVALLLGVPLGVTIGRWAWLVFAGELGVAPRVVVPALPLLVAVPANAPRRQRGGRSARAPGRPGAPGSGAAGRVVPTNRRHWLSNPIVSDAQKMRASRRSSKGARGRQHPAGGLALAGR